MERLSQSFYCESDAHGLFESKNSCNYSLGFVLCVFAVNLNIGAAILAYMAPRIEEDDTFGSEQVQNEEESVEGDNKSKSAGNSPERDFDEDKKEPDRISNNNPDDQASADVFNSFETGITEATSQISIAEMHSDRLIGTCDSNSPTKETSEKQKDDDAPFDCKDPRETPSSHHRNSYVDPITGEAASSIENCSVDSGSSNRSLVQNLSFDLM